MPASAAWTLHEQVHHRLVTDATLTALLGGARVFDHVPHNSALPYLTFGQSVARDWATGTEDGEEHTLTLHVWTEGGSRRQAQEIMSALKSRLDDAPLALADHRLVGLRHELSEARREAETELFHGIVRYRAVTEPLS